MQHLLILGDQLTTQVGPIAQANPDNTMILMIESVERGRAFPYHKQKLVLIYSAMRHFAQHLRQRGFTVHYRHVAHFADGITEHLGEYPGITLTLMEPADYGVASFFQQTISAAGGHLQIVPNQLWISSHEDWERYANGKKQLRMEFFYREMRRKTGWLMEQGQPIGGQWNYDSENRQVPPAHHQFPPAPQIVTDPLTHETIKWVEQTFPDHPGQSQPFHWPVTREQALACLDQFLVQRLALFGPYEDAMLQQQYVLYHSLLSAAINLGLLTPREVCEAALTYAKHHPVPLPSLEGFIRQILGWREFMHHIYRQKMPQFRLENRLQHHRALPNFYWDGHTDMNCLRSTIHQLLETGHTHHIQRLMVLGNFALLAGIQPQQLNDWFLSMYVDAFDWVVSPNVLGMSQYADLGSFTSKPYISGAAYINRMSNYCQNCRYQPQQTLGPNACPFASLYWHFIDRHASQLKTNQRMAMIVNGWLKRSPADQQAILAQAEIMLQQLDNHNL